MNNRRLFVASCISLATAAFAFIIRGDIGGPFSAAFHLTNEQMGVMYSPGFYAFAVAILISGVMVDLVGMRTLHVLSALGFIAGVGLITLARPPAGPVESVFETTGTTMAYLGFFCFGLSHGLVEGVINPLLAAVYPNEKTKRIVAVHAWWPGGLILGGLIALGLAQFFQASWQLRLTVVLIPALGYLAMALSMPYPQTERAAHEVPTSVMWKQATRPLFLLIFACMWLTAAVELGTDQWFPTVMGALVPQLSPEAGSGVAFLVYTAGLMFVLRMWASGFAHKSPIGTLVFSAALSAIGLYWLGALTPESGAVIAIAAATIFGVGKTFFWPTMVGVTAELFPRGGALLLALVGAAGMTSVSVAVPFMGARMDIAGPGAALQSMAGLAVVLVFVFGGLWVFFRTRGGYRPVHISEEAVDPVVDAARA